MLESGEDVLSCFHKSGIEFQYVPMRHLQYKAVAFFYKVIHRDSL
ncbi:hypothetical protein HMPREF1548_00602 [Clostridium sp. KLE 1755]|nr:hypothetical protein HMPREF1548_00602 [Clostridium sp. KLE 1755]